MVRPESCITPTGESPVRVIAGAPGSRHQQLEVIPVAERCVESLFGGSEGAGRNKVNASASSDYQPKGVREGRAAHVTAKATDSSQGLERLLELSGVGVVARLQKKDVEQERPYLAAKSGKDRAYKAGRLKARGARRESEGLVVPMKACNKTRWREGALL